MLVERWLLVRHVGESKDPGQADPAIGDLSNCKTVGSASSTGNHRRWPQALRRKRSVLAIHCCHSSPTNPFCSKPILQSCEPPNSRLNDWTMPAHSTASASSLTWPTMRLYRRFLFRGLLTVLTHHLAHPRPHTTNMKSRKCDNRQKSAPEPHADTRVSPMSPSQHCLFRRVRPSNQLLRDIRQTETGDKTNFGSGFTSRSDDHKIFIGILIPSFRPMCHDIAQAHRSPRTLEHVIKYKTMIQYGATTIHVPLSTRISNQDLPQSIDLLCRSRHLCHPAYQLPMRYQVVYANPRGGRWKRSL